jgi:hypothetical protein
MTDETFNRNVNEIGADLFFHAAALYERYSQEEVIIGMASCLSQSLAGRSISPATLRTVIAVINQGLEAVGPEFGETIELLRRAASGARKPPRGG